MAQAQSRRSAPRRSAETPTPSSKPAPAQDAEKVAKATEKASAESQQKPRSAKAQAKAAEEFNADERIVQRSSYDGGTQTTRYGSEYRYDQHPSEK